HTLPNCELGRVRIVGVLALIVFGTVVDAQSTHARRGGETGPITREQAEAILTELRAIHQLLDRQPSSSARPASSLPTVRMAVGDGWYAVGRDDAPVTIVEFSDYECPFCRRFHLETFPELKKNYVDTGKVRFVSRDLPLDIHANAFRAALTARCAGDQGRF